MNENIADQDIIHLLNTKRKNREILSVTNAAVDAVSSQEHAKTKPSNKDKFTSLSPRQRRDILSIINENTKENINTSTISDSFSSTSSKDTSFNAKYKVRVPSRLLREIKSPLERCVQVNKKSSSESGTMSNSTLFASQFSSDQSSVRATGPVPTVIKYSPEPQIKTNMTTGDQNISHRSATPVVVKNSQGYFASGTSRHSVNSVLTEVDKNYPDTRTDDNTDRDQHIWPSDQIAGAENGLDVSRTKSDSKTNNDKGKLASSNSETKKPTSPSLQGSQDYFMKETNQRGTGLCQGALSHNLIHAVNSEKGQVKAVSFSLSEREKATREMLSKRQESKGAIRRVVQAKLVTATSSEEEHVKMPPSSKEKESSVISNVVSSENIAVDCSSLPISFEKQMKSLRDTLDVIEVQCQESRVWQEQHQRELEMNVKQHDERRLQNLEYMQKRLLECQLKNAQYITPMAKLPVSSTSQELPNTQMKSNMQEESPPVKPQATGKPDRNIVQGVSPHNPQYNQAMKHNTQPAFKTSVYSKPSDISVQSGLKRKFVRNTRTQTSPRDSSSFSSSTSEMTSPLETPLPRRCPPVPMSRDSKTARKSSKKQVHFDTPDVRNTHVNPGKRKDGRHDKGDEKTTVGGDSQTRYTNKPRYCIAREDIVNKRRESADYIVNDIGKLRQELHDALKDTERTKQSLKNLHNNIHSQISDEDDGALVPPDHTQPYPIDAYLRATRDIPEELQTTRAAQETTPTESCDKFHPPGHYAHTSSVLRDVQKQKEILEANLLSLTRQHNEEHVYKLLDDLSNGEATSETLRIRKEVAKKIEEIGTAVETELQDEERERLVLQKETSVENKKMSRPTTRSSKGVPLSAERRSRTRDIGKVNQPRGKPVAAKPKQTTKTVAKQPPTKRSLDDLSYVSRVYGRHDHVPRRTTLKSAFTHHQSPVRLPRGNTGMVDTSRHERRWDDSVSTLSEDRVPQNKSHQPKYYFQPSLDASHVFMKTHGKHLQTPLPGQLLPMAIPLGKPRTDPSLRLPVSTSSDLPQSTRLQTVSSSVTQPNVAVITIKDEENLQDDDQHGQQKKVKKSTQSKERTALETQILPNLDIDSSSFSDVSESPPATVKVVGPQILLSSDPLRRPDLSEYNEFKDYEKVRSAENMQDEEDDEECKPEGESVITLHGSNTERKSPYQGPAFPPENIPASHVCDDFEVDVAKTTSETLEKKAIEWVEQELLARVVSQMVPPLPDPTTSKRRPSSSFTNSDVSDHEVEADLLGTIGPRGIQLFVDAGIPVDHDLVRNLVLEVLREEVRTMLGYPEPHAEPSPEQKPTEDKTEDQALSEESTWLETPVQTPSAASLPASRPPSHVPTPEQTASEESSSSLLLSDENKSVVRSDLVDDDEIEEGLLDDSDHEHDVTTPVVTPKSSPHAQVPVLNLYTPEVSEQDPPESEKTGIETPEITVSIRDRTLSPEDLEVDLKEQTFVEDEKDEDKEPDVIIPAIKFIPEPEPSVTTVTNSPSSMTTTNTYSTQSTMGTFATDDEISEGEQLQPFVHVGQYSEGEFAPPSALVHASDNMATMREIPDDIFDSFRTANKPRDVFKRAVRGLLHEEEEKGDGASEATAEETSTSTDGQGRDVSLLSQGTLCEDISQSEGEVGRDVVAALLAQIRRQPLSRKRRALQEQYFGEDDNASVGEAVVQRDDKFTLSRGRLPRVVSEGDLSAGEVATQVVNPNLTDLPVLSRGQSMSRPQGPSVFDSDENNNESDHSSSMHDGENQNWSKTDMVTPQKSTRTSSMFPRIVHVTEARHESTPANLSLVGQRKEPGPEDNVTMETLSDIAPEVASGTHIQVRLPSVDPSVSPTMSEGTLIVDFDDTIGDDASSISGGEI